VFPYDEGKDGFYDFPRNRTTSIRSARRFQNGLVTGQFPNGSKIVATGGLQMAGHVLE
jgi:hypothetical protein